MWDRAAFAGRYGRQDVLAMMYDMPAPTFYKYMEALNRVLQNESPGFEDALD